MFLSVSLLTALFLPVFSYAQTFPDGKLLRGENDVKVYLINNGIKRWLKNIDVFNSYHLSWKDVQVVTGKTINAIPSVKLVQVKDDVKVYLVNNLGYRRHIPNPDVFNDYGFNWSDIVPVNTEELSVYSESYLVKKASDPNIHFIQGDKKQLITSVEAFYKNDFDWNAVSVVSEKEFNAYQQGNNITPEVKVERKPTPASLSTSLPATPSQPVVPLTATSTSPTSTPTPSDGTPTAPTPTPAPDSATSPTPAPLPTPISDATPPQISDVKGWTTGLTGQNNAAVSWSTDENSTSEVEYGLNTAYGSTLSDPVLTQSHYLLLSGLQPTTLYHFRVKSKDAAGNVGISGDYTFTTPTPAPLPMPSPTPSAVPEISNVSATVMGPYSAQIQWATDQGGTTSIVEYGLTSAYGSTVSDLNFTRTHDVSLSGLQANTLYHFRVKSAYDVAGNNAGVSSDYTFTTKPISQADTTAPLIASVSGVATGQNSAQIQWSTNESAYNEIEYGLTSSYGSIKSDPNLTLLPIFSLSGLQSGTLYHYRVQSRDVAGNVGTSADYTFITQAGATLDTTPPTISLIAPVNGITVGTAVSNVSNADAVEITANASDNVGVVAVQYKVDGVDLGFEDKQVPYTVFWSSLTVANGSHILTAVARDAAGNTATSNSVTITTCNKFIKPACKP